MNTPFFDSLIDDFGIWQHTDGQHPLPEHGYALDDATRGLIACLALDRQTQAHTLFDYVIRSRNDTDFYGFATDKRQFFDFPSSEDAKGQVIWALGYAIHRDFESGRAARLIRDIGPSLSAMQSLRGPAYALLGAVYCEDRSLADNLKNRLLRQYEGQTNDWFWPEDKLTYANAIMPYALLRYAHTFNDPHTAALGRKVLDFVERCCTMGGRIRGPIGYDGWFSKGSAQPANDGQQAIDAAYMIWAWMSAYQLSHDDRDLAKANAWMAWFEGKNIAGISMYDHKTLKTYDGINLHAADDHHDARGINYHSGAESNICLILTKHVLQTKQTL